MSIYQGRTKPWLIMILLFSLFIIPNLAHAQDSTPGIGSYQYEGWMLDEEDNQLSSEPDVIYWNSTTGFHVKFNAPEWRVTEVQLYAGFDPPPIKYDKKDPSKDKLAINEFPCKRDIVSEEGTQIANCLLKEDFALGWRQSQSRTRLVAIHGDMVRTDNPKQESSFWVVADLANPTADMETELKKGYYFKTPFTQPQHGHFIDAPVLGLSFRSPTHWGTTAQGGDRGSGGFGFFPHEMIKFSIGSVPLGIAPAAQKVSPLDLFESADIDDPEVIGVARVLQTLDYDSGAEKRDGKIVIVPEVVTCFENIVGAGAVLDFGDEDEITNILNTVVSQCNGLDFVPLESDAVVASEEESAPYVTNLAVVGPDEAQNNLETGLSESGIFRKNMSKTEEWGETKQKLEVMPVYFPGMRSNGEPSYCCVDDPETEADECNPDICEGDIIDDVEYCGEPGVPYEEWRLNGDATAEECDPRLFPDDPLTCQVTLIECRDVAKPILTTYMGKVDIYDDAHVKEEFWDGRFSWDLYTAISRDDGTTWKRMNVSRMADMSSFELETGEPFPGTVGSPYLKVNDNKILVVWESKFCKSGNPRYSINTCDDPATEEVEADDPATTDVNECAVYCRGNADQGTEVCEPDYPGDDAYYVTDIWGVRGQQQSVDYNEVDDVAELGIGEIPYSCLWAARGVIASQKELDEGTFASMTIMDDNETPDILDDDFERSVVLGDIVWFKPERITSGRRDVYIPMIGSARGAGFAIAWQEDPSGLRPGKGKGPGEGWSGAITNHKSDMWYSYISYDDFNIVDEDFESRGPGGGTDGEPTGDEGYLDKPGLGRPKALVPFSLPVRVTDNDMVNTHTLKVEPSENCPPFPDSTGLNDPVCFPEVVDGSFVPIDTEEIAAEFCGHPDADPATCCDPDDHEGDPNCEDLKGLYGNLNGTKRYAYQARDIDELCSEGSIEPECFDDQGTLKLGTYVAGGDGIPDYQYYLDNGGTLDLCDLSGDNTFFGMMPGTSAHERWFGFTNSAGVDKLVCVANDGRLLDGDVYASRPMLQLQPYTKPDGTKSAWALLAYEESKGLGHSLAAEAHDDTDNPVDEIVNDDKGQEKPIKQDIGKNMMYHSFDFTQPDLVAPGHIANLPALCGGLYPTYCDDEDNPTCTCTPGQPVPLYFDYYVDNGDGTGDWIPDDTKFLQFRTEIARRARFLMQSPGKMGDTKTLGALIYKQGQEGQGRPADAFIRRFVKSGQGNPYMFENMECTKYLDETFALPACPNGAGDKPSAVGYNCNVWGEASGDRLCGGVFTDPNGGYPRRDHVNLTSANVDLAVGTPVDDTPQDLTDDVYSRNKVLLWSQHIENLGDESFGWLNGTTCDPLSGGVCPGMYSNVRSHRGFIRGDFFVVAYALSPNWAAGRNGNDRYNFYVRKSFDGGQTWTTNPDGAGVYVCPEFRTDPYTEDPDGSGNLPPEVFNELCGTYDSEAVPEGDLPPMPVGVAMTHFADPLDANPDGVSGQYIAAGAFEPARNVSEIKSNKESSGDPRLGTTPPTYPLDGTDAGLANLCPGDPPDCTYVEDNYENHMFFVAWGTVDNAKSTGSSGVKAEAGPLDIYYTRSEDYGDNFVKIPWVIGGVAEEDEGEEGPDNNDAWGQTVWRYDFVAKGEPEEQGEAQLRATSDGSKAYVIWHSQISAEEDPDEVYTRYYPWKPSESSENDLWFRRLIFWPDEATQDSVEYIRENNLFPFDELSAFIADAATEITTVAVDFAGQIFLPLMAYNDPMDVPVPVVAEPDVASAQVSQEANTTEVHVYLPFVSRE